MSDELDTILRLVAEGRLSPEEAEPIIETLTRAAEGAGENADDRAGRRMDEATGRRGRHLRIRVTERGRQVVNLNIPIGLVEGAMQWVPGIGPDQRERVRAAVRAGQVGPILDVEDDDGDGVLITVE